MHSLLDIYSQMQFAKKLKGKLPYFDQSFFQTMWSEASQSEEIS